MGCLFLLLLKLCGSTNCRLASPRLLLLQYDILLKIEFYINNWFQHIIQHYTTNAHCRVLLILNCQVLSLLRVVCNDEETILLLTTFFLYRRRVASATSGTLSCPSPSLVASCMVFHFFLRQLSFMFIPFYRWPSFSPQPLQLFFFSKLPSLSLAIHPNCVMG
jgi:hypothetical protein